MTSHSPPPDGPAGRQIRVFIVNARPVIRTGVRAILTAEPGLTVFGDAADLAATLANLAATPVDVLVADLPHPRAGGVSLLRDLRDYYPNCRAVAFVDDHYAGLADAYRDAGAGGFATHREPAEALVHAVRAAAAAPDVVPGPPANETRAAGGLLTPGERQVLLLIGRGLSSRDIAAALHRSVKTVETYRSRIKRKLGLDNTTQLAQAAARAASERYGIERGAG